MAINSAFLAYGPGAGTSNASVTAAATTGVNVPTGKYAFIGTGKFFIRFGTATTHAEKEAAIATMRLLNGFLRYMQEAGPWIDAAGDPDLHIGPLTLAQYKQFLELKKRFEPEE